MSAERAVMLAIQAAGRFDDEWELRVNMAVPVVAGLLREQSDAMRVAAMVLDAQAIIGEYRAKRLEASSQRLIVAIKADNSEEIEEVRTRRVDEPGGKAMEVRLMGLQPGERCIFFKAVEKLDQRKSVRYLVGFERQPYRNSRPEPTRPRPSGTGAVRPSERDATPSSDEAPAPNLSRVAIIRGLLSELTEEKRLKAISMLAAKGWEHADDIPNGVDFERAMYIARYQRDDYF